MGLYRYYDPTIGKRRPLKSVAIVNSDGTNEYTPNQIKAIEDDLIAHKVDCVHLPYSIADGTNTYTTLINGISSLAEGMSIKIKFTNANTGASTLNINGLGAKPIQKSNGNALSSGNIKAGQICHLVYTGSVFQLLGEGGEYGTAQAQDVLEGKTIGTEEGLVTGTMPNIGKQTGRITTKGGRKYISKGYHDGTGYIDYDDPNHIARNIKDGVNIGGVKGNFEGLIRIVNDTSNDIKQKIDINKTFSNEILLLTISINYSGDYRLEGTFNRTKSIDNSEIVITRLINGIFDNRQSINMETNTGKYFYYDINRVKKGDVIKLYAKCDTQPIRIQGVSLTYSITQKPIITI